MVLRKCWKYSQFLTSIYLLETLASDGSDKILEAKLVLVASVDLLETMSNM